MDIFITGLDFSHNAEEAKKLNLLSIGEEVKASKKLHKICNQSFAIILTCVRLEVVSIGNKVNHESIERSFNLNTLKVKNCRYSFTNEEAIKHLFLLSSGILSPLFGEEAILSQFKRSILVAEYSLTSNNKINKLLNFALSFGKEVREKENFSFLDETIIEEVKKKVGNNKSILIIGSGEKARILASSLMENNKVTMTLRDESKTYLIPPGISYISYDKRKEEVKNHSVIISITSGLYYTFTDEDSLLLKNKILFDLSLPYDIPSTLNPIRIENIEQPKKQELIERINKKADCKLAEYLKWDNSSNSYEEINENGLILANEVARKLERTINELNINEVEKISLENVIKETIRKTYINKELSRKK